MKTKLTVYLIFAFLTSGCLISCKKLRKPEAQTEREQWIAGFTDSIDYYQDRKAEIEQKLDVVNAEIMEALNNFEMVKNPREVSGYYILRGWNKKLPFTSTGIYARINENDKLELIATLGGSTFNKLGVGTGSTLFFSETVPHDQAFNYRHERFNTVYFSGGKADTIAEYIATHNNEKVVLDFIEGSKKHSFTLPVDEKSMISQTWNLHSYQLKARELQKELFICSRKIDTFRRIMDMQNQTPADKNSVE